MKLSYSKILSILALAILSTLFYKSHYFDRAKIHVKSWISSKPILRVGVVRFEDTRPDGFWNEDNAYSFWGMLSDKYTVEKVDSKNQNDYDILITGYLPETEYIKNSNPNLIKIHYTYETYTGKPAEHLKDHDLVMGFDSIDAPNYIRLPFYYLFFKDKIRHDYERKEQKCAPQKKKHFACFLASNGAYDIVHTLDSHGNLHSLTGHDFNGAHLRNRLFHLLSLYKPVMSGGRWLNNTRGPIPRGTELEWLSQCKFTIAYENDISYPGYITEKPFQAWFAGTVPLYNSHPDSLVDINKNAVIYAGDFKTEEELVEYIKKVDNDDELYCKIWNERLLTDPEKDYSVVRAKVTKKLDEILAKKFGK
ncbi:MAG: glycosyltransferase family 10 [Pseudomonadota bacterium]